MRKNSLFTGPNRRFKRHCHLMIDQSKILLFFEANLSSSFSASTDATSLKVQVCSSRSVSISLTAATAFKSFRTEASQPLHVMLGSLIETC